MHRPINRERDTAETMVIFIHGFMGSPDQFSDLADAVYEKGCSTMSILLPGHGAGMGEFVRSNMRDWERHVQSEIDRVDERYKKIILVGHSMGGLLALGASLAPDSRVAGVLTIATPLKINKKSFYIKLQMMTRPSMSEIKRAYFRATSIGRSAFWHYLILSRPLYHLFRLIKQTRGRLAEVTVPVTLFYSRGDETVDYRSAKFFEEGLCNTEPTVVTLDKSWHAYYDAAERAVIVGKLLEMVG